MSETLEAEVWSRSDLNSLPLRCEHSASNRIRELVAVKCGCHLSTLVPLAPISREKTLYFQCRGRGSNPHEAFAPEDFKSSRVCHFATPASIEHDLLNHKRSRARRSLAVAAGDCRFSPARDAYMLDCLVTEMLDGCGRVAPIASGRKRRLAGSEIRGIGT